MADLINGRYRVESRLGTGGMGTVDLATDLARDGALIALKRVEPARGERGQDAEAIAALTREFETLARLRHPNLPAVHDWGRIEGTGSLFISMDYVKGQDLLSASPTLTPEQTLDAVAQTCRALEFIHTRGLVHRDVKPENILVTTDGAALKAVLVDFGLAEQVRDRALPRGTLHYVAPEILKGGRADRRADLYALGVLLYRLCAGRCPFEGQPEDVLRGHLERKPEDPSKIEPPSAAPLRPLANEPFVSVILRLLEKDPARRYGSAVDVLRAINRATGIDHAIETPETAEAYAAWAPLVGRERELAALESAISRPRQHGGKNGAARGPGVLLVVGEAGAGKTRFLHEAKRKAQLSGALCAIVTCGQDVPAFQPIAEVISLLGAPPLPLATGGTEPQAAPEKARLKIVDAAADSMAARIGSDPAALLLDDAHLADPGTLDVCEALARGGYGAPGLTVVLAYRPEEIEGTPLNDCLARLRRLSGIEEIAIPALSREQTGDLLGEMLGLAEVPIKLLDLVHRETSGNAFFVEQAVRSLLEDGTISRVGDRFRADVDALSSVSFPAGAAEAIRRRLTRITADERNVLESLSVIARPAQLDLVLAASQLPEQRASAAIASLRERRIVADIPSEDGPLLAVSNARTREFVYGGTEWERRRALHARIAAALESAIDRGETIRYEETARHFINGADPQTALGYALEAAERSRRLGAAADAIAFYRTALELLPAGAGAQRAEIFWKIGLVERVLLRAAPAMESFEQSLRAAAGASRRDLVARARIEKADLHLRRGRPEEAIHEIERAREILTEDGDPALVARTYSMLASAFGRAGRMDRARELQVRALEHAERAGDPSATAAALNNLGMIDCLTGRMDDGVAFLERAIRARRSSGDRNGELETAGNLGTLLAGAGDLDRALHYLEPCLQLTREIGDLRMIVEAAINLGGVLSATGQTDRAVRCFEEAAAVALRIGDDARASNALDAWGVSLRTLDDLEGAVERHAQALECAQRCGDAAQIRFALGSLAIDHAAAGRFAEARDALRKADRLPGAGIPARARLRLAEAAALVRLGEGKAEEAEESAKEMLEISRAGRIPQDEARSLHLIGLALAARGETSEAVAMLDQASERAAAARSDESRWKILADLGDLRRRSGDVAAAKARVEEAASIIEVLSSKIGDEEIRRRYLASPQRAHVLETREASTSQPPGHPSAGGALSALYRMSEIITSASDLDELLSRVLDLALEIVRAERGLIILLGEDGERQEVRAARGVEPETIADALEYSRSVVRAAAGGATLVSLDAEADQRFRRFGSVGLFQIKSLACVPMKVRDRMLGTVYLDSRRQGYLFREDDVEFLKAFANLAGSAIEIARLNAALSSENVTLRREVQDLRKVAVKRTHYQSIIGRTVRMQAIYDLLERVSVSTLPVLITGESGTGKELVARALHFGGPRRDRKFFTENVAAIPDTLLESELFGHVRGAFTGADRDRKGVFELASGGTLFLDEIGDMSLPLQSKVLRALQEGEIRPVGGKDAVKVDVRIVSATNRDIEAMVRDGRFREDLYYRLNVVRIQIPPLRERKEDIPLLIDHFLERTAQPSGAPPKRFDIAALQFLLRYDWPGNVRELENELMKLAVLCPRDVITQSDIAESRDLFEKLTRLDKEREGFPKLDVMERRQIERALAEAGGNRVRAAELLGISRATIYRKLREYKISL